MTTLNKHINAFRFLGMLIYEKMHIFELGTFSLVIFSLQKDFRVKPAFPEGV